MKTSIASLFAATAVILLGTVITKSQDTSTLAETKNERLSGHDLTTLDAVKKADFICVAKVIDIGSGGGKSTSSTAYHGTQLKIETNLRGSVKSPLMVSLFARWATGRDTHDEEVSPKINNSYLFFIRQVPGYYLVVKILPNQKENITSVEQILAGNLN